MMVTEEGRVIRGVPDLFKYYSIGLHVTGPEFGVIVLSRYGRFTAI
jgi:hypothetical protein